jgi:tRNA (cytidine/uridine-2'-O-)-methyltransferase
MSQSTVMPGAHLPDPRREDLLVEVPVPPLRVVLVEPRIPPNVGAVSRICAAVGAPLVLVGPVTFREDHPARRRAGLDYWHLVEKIHLQDFQGLLRAYPEVGMHLFSTRAGSSLYEAVFSAGDLLIFGSEDDGLPGWIQDAHPEACVRIPMVRGVRSLNLSSAVAIGVFEAVRQLAAGKRPDGRPEVGEAS